MAQTIIVQEQALSAAQQRIDELEQGGQARRPQGGFLDSIFGGSHQRAVGTSSRPHPRSDTGYTRGGPWGGHRSMGGGGFLAGAAQTAMGVAGGVMLGNMLADWMSPDEAGAGLGDQAAGGGDEGGVFGGGDAGETQFANAGGDLGGDFDLGDF